MERFMVHGMILSASVTDADVAGLDAVTVDERLLHAADIQAGERVTVIDRGTGRQVQAYALPTRAQGRIAVGGACAVHIVRGAGVSIVSHAAVSDQEAATRTGYVVHVDAGNQIVGTGGPAAQTGPTENSPVPVLPRPWALTVLTTADDDVRQVQGWMNQPDIAPAWGRAWTRKRWADEIERQVHGGHSWPCLVSHDGRTVGYLEIYRVPHDSLAAYVSARPGDIGVHIALASADSRDRGLGTELLRTVSDALLREADGCTRVIAEPNATNRRAVRAFEKAGFRDTGEITLPSKTAALMVKEQRA